MTKLWTGHESVTDGRADGRTDRRTEPITISPFLPRKGGRQMQQCENVTKRNSENKTDGMRIYDQFYVSFFRPPSVVFKLCCLENQKKKKRKHKGTTKSNFVVSLCFRIWRRRSENTTWRKSATIILALLFVCVFLFNLLPIDKNNYWLVCHQKFILT
jgi:hypothetical protein